MKKKALALSVLAAISSQAGAFQFDSGDDWAIRWDNTFKANVMSRVTKQDPDVYAAAGLTAQLADDSDLTVDRSGGGLVSTRVDVLSELDVIWRQNWGFRISGSGWYDYAYKDGENDTLTSGGPLPNGFPNYDSTWGSLTAKPGDYTNAASDLHYAGGELLDAFVFGNWDIGETALGVRAGRHTLFWGQSLLTTGALIGIPGGMAAIDIAKGYSVPGSEVKELFMPNNKVSASWQLTDNLTVSSFYAFEHIVNRFPEAGTYFSPVELLTENSEFLTIAPGGAGPRAGYKVNDDKIKDSGEWGVNFQYSIEPWALDASLVYINYTDRNVSGLYGSSGGVDPAVFNKWIRPWDQGGANAAVIGTYGWVYKNDNDMYGLSLAKSMFDVSWGMDLVFRKDGPLNPDLASSLLGRAPASAGDWSSDGKYPGPTGDIWTLVVNGLGLMNSDWGLWDGGSWIFEYTAAMLSSYGDNAEYTSLRVHEDRVVTNIGFQWKPTWYQVLPGWDMTFVAAGGYTIDGEQSPISNAGNEEIGNGSLGFDFLGNEVWNLSARYNVFFGPAANGTAGLVKDRDNISLTVKRTW